MIEIPDDYIPQVRVARSPGHGGRGDYGYDGYGTCKV